MKKVAIAMTATYLLTGCRDIPYQEKEPKLILEEAVTKNVLHETKSISQPTEVIEAEIPIIERESSPRTNPDKNNRGNDNKEPSLPESNLLIDTTPPKIIGANDGVAQSPYLQETIHYSQKFIEDGKNSRYEIDSAGKPTGLDFANSPTISRWIARIDDEETAPGYSFKVDDDDASVKYSLSNECVTIEKSTKEASKNEDGIYTIRITQENSDFDLSQSSGDKKYCLSIWASDEAGNKSNHQTEFYWNVIVPPISMDVNTSKYKAHHREDDISYTEQPPRDLFTGRNPIVLKNDLVVGHVILANPFSSSLSAKLDLQKPLGLRIKDRSYPIQPNLITIRYFSYDLSNNEVGVEKAVKDGYVVIDSNETLLAKLVLGNVLPINNIKEPNDRFWQRFSLELDFPQSDDSNNSIVDGLTLTTRDISTNLSTKFLVPWGNDHDVRRR